jgi:hypothetical protein
VVNAGVPAINKPTKEEATRQAEEPDWLLTMPAGVRKVHVYWRENLSNCSAGW